jgi:hypothetical protein
MFIVTRSDKRPQDLISCDLLNNEFTAAIILQIMKLLWLQSLIIRLNLALFLLLIVSRKQGTLQRLLIIVVWSIILTWISGLLF